MSSDAPTASMRPRQTASASASGCLALTVQTLALTTTMSATGIASARTVPPQIIHATMQRVRKRVIAKTPEMTEHEMRSTRIRQAKLFSNQEASDKPRRWVKSEQPLLKGYPPTLLLI